MIALLFGSSARRGATGWTDRARVRSVIDALLPDAVIDGASPAGGADQLAHEEAREHFTARGIAPENARRCPVDTSLDGPWPAAGHRRNARMYRTHRPTIAAGFVSGKVGSPLSSGSAGMARICREGGTPLVVIREDGVEPDPTPLRTMRLLHALDASLLAPWHAVNAWKKGAAPQDEVLAALGYAREGSRFGVWLEAVERAVRAGESRGPRPPQSRPRP